MSRPAQPAPATVLCPPPFRAWTSIVWSPGNTYLQKRGTTHAGVFRPGASGSPEQRITIAAYARADGTDDPSQPSPVILLPGQPVTPQAGGSVAVFGQERDFISYLVNGAAAQLDRNTVTGMLSGILISSGERNRVSNNNCSANMNFGIHVTGFATSFLIEAMGDHWTMAPKASGSASTTACSAARCCPTT